MTNRILFILLLLSIFSGCTSTECEDKSLGFSKNELLEIKQNFKSLHELLKNDNAMMWKQPLYGPTMLINPKNRSIICNMVDRAGVLKKTCDLYLGILPDSIGIANTSIIWNGERWSMVMLPLPKNKANRNNLLIHESFHRIQPNIGFNNMYGNSCAHLDKIDGRISLRLELEALKKALKDTLSSSRKTALRDAMTFRQYRYMLYPDSRENENNLELNEGLAEYTGAILSGRNEQDLREHFAQSIDRFMQNPTFVRSFAYVTLPVYGFFIYKKDPGWNLEISKKSNLTDFISAFFNFRADKNIADKFESTRNRYGFKKIFIEESERESKKREMINHYKSLFVQDNILQIDLIQMNISFDPRNIFPLPGLGTVYPTIQVIDQWGTLNAKKGALLSADWRRLTLSPPDSMKNSDARGDGWKLKLKNGWRIEKGRKSYKITHK